MLNAATFHRAMTDAEAIRAVALALAAAAAIVVLFFVAFGGAVLWRMARSR